MARDAGVETIRWFTTDACYVFHPMNAWEEGDKIFADVMEYPVAPLFPTLDGKPPRDAFARLVRWTFDLAGNVNTIKREPLDDLAGEFPRFDERRAGLGLSPRLVRRASPAPARSDRASTPSRTSTCRAAGARTTSSTPAIRRASRCSCRAPPMRPRATAGWWRWSIAAREDRSDFVVFDAQDVAAGPIGAAKLPRRVPFGFHGNWRSA